MGHAINYRKKYMYKWKTTILQPRSKVNSYILIEKGGYSSKVIKRHLRLISVGTHMLFGARPP